MSNVAVALNTALMGDGAVIRVAAGAATDRPLHLLFVASEKPSAMFVRSLVVIEKGDNREGSNKRSVNKKWYAAHELPPGEPDEGALA